MGLNASFDAATGILAVVPDAWHSVATTRHHLLSRLAKWRPVVWVEPAAGWRDYARIGGQRFMQRRVWHTPTPGLDVFTPGSFDAEMFKPAIARRIAARRRYAAAIERLRQRGAERIVLYVWRDGFADAIDHASHDLSCYHLDDEYTFSDVDMPVGEREARLLQRVDQVFVHSRTLLAKKGHFNPNTMLVPNGVDHAAYTRAQPEPADLAAIPHPRIGCIGVIKRQLDIARIERLARARAHWSFVMIGPRGQLAGKEAALDALQALPNVHVLGHRPAAALPAYTQHLDVGLMPYENNGYTRYIDPLKLKEYLAAGLPVVATPIDAVLTYRDVVACPDDDAQWLAAIELAIAQRHDSDALQARRARASYFDWDGLARRVVDAIDRRFVGRASASIGTVAALRESQP